jgi:hypothetical protein
MRSRFLPEKEGARRCKEGARREGARRHHTETK